MNEPAHQMLPEKSDNNDLVNMVEIKEMQLEENAEIIEMVGADDLTCCSYPKGYVPRQVIYICIICQPNPDDMAGFCSACAIKCHKGHHVYPIGSKRYFRCDCGNQKFKKTPCLLYAVCII
ncbi:hypothetical protein HZS_7796 [Henneguya salminicola]|uniref:Putative E3 ubiquitin-protein ligase UBR7 (Trinotate prediction) n=1 Tax=Henneguya salminicola TaxID=69463 RepID=A0A6G3MFM7_HENSL|nr:hypothetical protein HZS_7796 [Henneguya salminicola]